jgi:pimeloyl-ACP methyl ester carboxylesterase
MPTIHRAGATIAYTRTGTGPAALLIQGGIVGDGWRPQVEALRGEFTLVSFDNRGIGGSTMNREPLSVEMLAADAVAVASLVGHDLADQPHIVMKQLKALSQHDAWSRLSSLRSMQTVVVSAEHDRIARVSSGRAPAAAIPGSRFIEMTGAGHGAPIQKAAEVNQLLREHWRTGQSHDAAV